MESEHQQRPCNLQLLSLADELLLSIVEQIDSHEDLCNVAATCSRLQGLAEPYIWRSLLVLSGDHACEMVEALRNRPERASSIRELAVRYNSDHEKGIEALNLFILRMDQLRHLCIESPCPNNHGGWRLGVSRFPFWTRIDYTRLFEDAVNSNLPSPPLAMLRSVTLHGHRNSEEPFLFGRTGILFFHPTLRDLTISCSNVDANIGLADIPPDKFKSTSLQSLTFIECNVYLPFLEVALSLPKALKELSIGERLHAWNGCVPTPSQERTSSPRFLEILQKQASSLERLVHNPGNSAWAGVDIDMLAGPANLQKLSKLKYLELDPTSPLFLYLKEAGYPESLTTLKLKDSAVALVPGYQIAPLNTLRAVHIHVIKCTLKAVNLDICFTYNTRPLLFADIWWGTPDSTDCFDRRMLVYKIATILKARGARLRLFGETFSNENSAFIPPYMYGEELPEEILLYDSDADLWTFVGKDYRAGDESRLPRELAAQCTACRDVHGQFCSNSGFGTRCAKCEELGAKCEYPPPLSPWALGCAE